MSALSVPAALAPPATASDAMGAGLMPRRFFLAGAAAWASTAAPPVLAAHRTPSVGHFHLPPHALAVDVKSYGSAIQFFDVIASKMDIQPRYLQLPLSRLLVERWVDIILFLAKTPARERDFAFASQPTMLMQPVLAVRSKASVQYVQTAAEIKGLTIGVYRDGYLPPLMQEPGVKTVPLPSDTLVTRGVQMLHLGRLDAFFSPDSHSLQWQIDELGLHDEVRVLPLPMAPIGLYTAFRRPHGLHYSEAFDRAHAQVASKLRYSTLLRALKRSSK